jgi:hypothetical protein
MQNDKINILLKIGGRPWTSPKGEQRVYFNNLAGLYGAQFEIDARGKPTAGALLGVPLAADTVPALHKALSGSKFYYSASLRTFVWDPAKGSGYDTDAVHRVIRASLIRLEEAAERGAI